MSIEISMIDRLIAERNAAEAEVTDLRRQLAEARTELLHYKTNGVSSIAQGRQIALTATE